MSEYSREEITKSIEIAKMDAPPIHVVKWKQEFDADSIRWFLEGIITLADYQRREQYRIPGSVTVDSIEAFTETLRLIELSPDKVEGMILHERRHFNIALEYGCIPSLSAQFAKKAFSIGFVGAFTSADLPEGIDKEKAREIVRAITIAPGEDMSPVDKSSLPTP